MGTIAIVESSLLILQVLIEMMIMMRSVRLMKSGENGVFPAFFTFATLSLLLSTFYTVIFSFLRPDARMPFAVDEIAESAMLLLLSAGLEALAGKDKKRDLRAALFAVIFMGANIALWIVWSGEWVQDILFGIPYMYLQYMLIKTMKRTGVVSGRERALAAIACGALIAMHVAQIYVTEGIIFTLTNVGLYLIEFGMAAWLFWKTIRALRKKEQSPQEQEGTLALALTVFLWTILVTFMNDGWVYEIALAVHTISLPIPYLAVKRVRREAYDLR
ncbi:MAG: hypothetical protein IKO03_00155 [Lachnospiraceae bacterium]|nr:hypothetical protein [Lachnospiraceae bacterium]